MNYHFKKLLENDRKDVIDISNYFIENSFAAYPESRVGYEIFDNVLKSTTGYPAITVKTDSQETIGVAWLRAFIPFDTMKRTATITYFILPEYTRKGIGTAILEHLIEKAKKMGIDTILANISSLNEKSINFHLKNGFREVGRFKKVGKKFGRDFDVVWMQKMI